MKVSIPGLLISLILCLYLVIIFPIGCIAVVEYSRGVEMAMSDTAELLDIIADTGYLSEDMLADYSLALASNPLNFTMELTRKTEVINPDPLNPGKTYSVHMVTDDIYNWKQGDIVKISVKQVGTNLYQEIARILCMLNIPDGDFTLARSVR